MTGVQDLLLIVDAVEKRLADVFLQFPAGGQRECETVRWEVVATIAAERRRIDEVRLAVFACR